MSKDKDRLDILIENMIKNDLLSLKSSFRDMYDKSFTDYNQLPYWYDRIRNYFVTPDTYYFILDYEWFSWLYTDKYTDEKIKEFTEYIKSNIPERFKNNLPVFIKTGVFSNKFVFSTCKIDDIDTIGKNFLDIYYGSMVVGCDASPYFVIREFINTDYERKTIYCGMKLNTEFRVFYDFNSKKVLHVHNYWEFDTMITSLYDKNDFNNFLEETDNINRDFDNLKEGLANYVDNTLKDKNVGLSGQWSLDFMYDGEKFILIDMALAKNSYYRENIEDCK